MLVADPLRAGGPDQPASVTLPALREGGVRAALGTIFIEPDGNDVCSYPAGDAEVANRLGLAQLELYRRWREAGEVVLFGDASGSGGGGASKSSAPLRLGILIEGADCIRSPEDLEWWRERGVVAVGLAWAKASRYAGGNSTELGLTELGRALVREMDRIGVVHDASHLSDRSLRELLEMTDRRVMASHSNSRVLMGTSNQRHLTDEAMREIAGRGGVIGLNLYSSFLIPGGPKAKGERATIEQAIAHVEHVCGVVGHRRAVGLGSDMDGGFTAAVLPAGIEHPRDLAKIAEGLRSRGWSDGEVEGFAWGNWARFWGFGSE